jgi:hypothetical protein
MSAGAARQLKRLAALKGFYGGDAAASKIALLREMERRRLARPRDVLALHEVLCFLRAYPDDAQVLEIVGRMLDAFARRGDLARCRRELADSGIAGTKIHYRFYWITARWLAQRWPRNLAIDWDEIEDPERIERLLPVLAAYFESLALDALDLTPREWLRRLAGPGETDASFLIRRFDRLAAAPVLKETLYEEVDVPIVLSPGTDTPSRTRAKLRNGPIVFQTRPLARERPSLVDEVRRPPRAVRPLAPREARRAIDLAREAMVTRSRDLDAFAYADERDVRMVDCGDGLQFACYGMLPERRHVLEAVYGFLTLRNGVPIGYVLASALLRSSEVAFNVFETYRGAEAGPVFGRVISMVRHLFGSDAFAIDPYQLGYGNEEGLKSGAWWFYYKLGFRPRDAHVRRVLRSELARMKARPGHRSSVKVLEKLASDYLYLFLGRPRRGVLGLFSPGALGLRLSRAVTERFGADRERAARECAREAAARLGLRSLRGFTRDERTAWERWSPLILRLPGVERWSAAQRRALILVVRAKGGRRESDFVSRFDRHRPLCDALLRMASDERGA